MTGFGIRPLMLAIMLVLGFGQAGCSTPQIAAGETHPPDYSRAEGVEPLRIMTWNLEHFTDPFDDPYVDSPFDNMGSNKSDQELKWIAHVIARVDPDVMALQEVEGDRAVKFFLDEYMPDHEYRYFACTPSMDWYQNVVVASKVPLGRIVSFREIEMVNEPAGRVENKYNNRLMAVEVIPNDNYRFKLVNLHMKAGRSDDDVEWRRLQIGVIKDYLQREKRIDPDMNIMVTGDMNFHYDSVEYRLMTSGSEPILVDPAAKWDGLLTHSSNAPSRQLDYVFFNRNMLRDMVPDSIAVATPLSLGHMSLLSDHLPVIVSVYPIDL